MLMMIMRTHLAFDDLTEFPYLLQRRSAKVGHLYNDISLINLRTNTTSRTNCGIMHKLWYHAQTVVVPVILSVANLLLLSSRLSKLQSKRFAISLIGETNSDFAG